MQDVQDGASWACGEKVWKPFMSIEPQKQQGEKVRRTLMCAARFCCLKQDGQDEQDEQDGAAREYGTKVWKTLMSIDISRKQDDKVREDLNMQRLLGCMRGTGPRATAATRPL